MSRFKSLLNIFIAFPSHILIYQTFGKTTQCSSYSGTQKQNSVFQHLNQGVIIFSWDFYSTLVPFANCKEMMRSCWNKRRWEVKSWSEFSTAFDVCGRFCTLLQRTSICHFFHWYQFFKCFSLQNNWLVLQPCDDQSMMMVFFNVWLGLFAWLFRPFEEKSLLASIYSRLRRLRV